MAYNVCMKSQAFNIYMPSQLVKRIDAQTKRQGASRSDFVRQAVNKQLAILEQWEQLTTKVRSQYAGKSMNETEVAEMVREQRAT